MAREEGADVLEELRGRAVGWFGLGWVGLERNGEWGRSENDRKRGEKKVPNAGGGSFGRNKMLPRSHAICPSLTSSFFTIAHGGAGPRCRRGKRGDKREAGEDERGLPRWHGGGGGDARPVIDLATVSVVEELCRRRRPLLLLLEHVFLPEVEVTAKEEDMMEGKRERKKMALSFLSFFADSDFADGDDNKDDGGLRRKKRQKALTSSFPKRESQIAGTLSHTIR